MNPVKPDETPARAVHLHRVFRAPPERLYRAFTQADAMAKWLPPKGFTAHVFEMNPVVGGAWRMAFTHFGSGHVHAFGGTYLEALPGERLVYTSAFDDAGLPGQMVTRVSLVAVSCGTELRASQSGIPEVIPLEGCYLGWQESLDQLACLVEAEIPG